MTKPPMLASCVWELDHGTSSWSLYSLNFFRRWHSLVRPQTAWEKGHSGARMLKAIHPTLVKVRLMHRASFSCHFAEVICAGTLR
jgi:hypothetical protein